MFVLTGTGCLVLLRTSDVGSLAGAKAKLGSSCLEFFTFLDILARTWHAEFVWFERASQLTAHRVARSLLPRRIGRSKVVGATTGHVKLGWLIQLNTHGKTALTFYSLRLDFISAGSWHHHLVIVLLAHILSEREARVLAFSGLMVRFIPHLRPHTFGTKLCFTALLTSTKSIIWRSLESLILVCILTWTRCRPVILLLMIVVVEGCHCY